MVSLSEPCFGRVMRVYGFVKLIEQTCFKKCAASPCGMPQWFQLVGVPKMKYLRLRSLYCETRWTWSGSSPR